MTDAVQQALDHLHAGSPCCGQALATIRQHIASLEQQLTAARGREERLSRDLVMLAEDCDGMTNGDWFAAKLRAAIKETASG